MPCPTCKKTDTFRAASKLDKYGSVWLVTWGCCDVQERGNADYVDKAIDARLGGRDE